MNKFYIFPIFLYCISFGQEKKDSINSKSNPFYDFKFRCYQLPGTKCPESLYPKDEKNKETKKPQIKQPQKEEEPEPSAYYIYSKQA